MPEDTQQAPTTESTESTQTTPAPGAPVETAQETTTTNANPDQFAPIVINNESFTLRGHVIPKGKGKGKLQCILEPEKVDDKLDYEGLYHRVKTAVGEENWNKTIFAEVVRQACLDATTAALKASDDGKPHDEDYAAAFIEYFLPSSRRSGEHIKDIRDRVGVIMSEVAPLLLRLNSNPNAPDYNPLSEEEMLRCTVLMEEFTTLNQKLEGASRKGDKGKKAKAPATAPAPAVAS